MTQIQKQSISVGNRSVGSVWVDGGAVRSDGDALHSELVIPLTISLEHTPADATIAVTALRASLLTRHTPDRLVTRPVSKRLTDGFPARSFPHGSADHVVELRFLIAAAELEAIEQQRHTVDADPFPLILRVEATVAGLKTFNSIEPGKPREDTPWNTGYGFFSQVMPFWQVRIEPVPVSVERSRWVREVLPGLGYDTTRLIEIEFPPPLPDHPSAALEWDKARRAFDEQRYGDCVSECRDLVAMWQKQLGTTKTRSIATVIAEKRGWSDIDGRSSFLDSVWKALVDLVNLPHHPEGKSSDQAFDAADARLTLLLTAALSAYVHA
jgi:hypothetical protein